MTKNTDSTGPNPTQRQATLWETFSRPGSVDITANYHQGNVHSEAAHKRAQHSATKDKTSILTALKAQGEASCEHLESLTGLSHQTCSARVSELKRDGLIVKCGTTKTKSGASAALYKLFL